MSAYVRQVRGRRGLGARRLGPRLVYRLGVVAGLRLRVAGWLERDAARGAIARVLSRGVGALTARGLRRHVVVPDGLASVTVGGSTVGGSGKTRVALACVRALAASGERVALVGHGYRARSGRGRVVLADDAVGEVGDEALACARALEAGGDARAFVVVGPSRAAALEAARSAGAAVVVFDGPLQLAPRRADVAILAVDADAPWGSGHVLPVGDLRAPREALVAAVDHVVRVASSPAHFDVHLDGAVVSLASLVAGGARLGLFTALARPARLEGALRMHDVRPAVVVRAPDHGPASARARAALRAAARDVDVWLATGKCATHLEGAALGVPVAILEDALVLPPTVELAILAAARRRRAGAPGRSELEAVEA